MTESLRNAVLDVLEGSRGLDVVRWFSRATPRILLYHRFGPRDAPGVLGAETFERQIAYLRQRFHILRLEDLVAWRRPGGSIPDNAVVLTVDDGYEDFYRYAYPVLRRYAAPATFYVVSRFIEGSMWLWPDLLRYALDRTQRRELSFALGTAQRSWSLEREEGKLAAWSDIADHCLTLGPGATLDLTRSLTETLGVDWLPSPPVEYCATTWDQLREMAAGGVEIGAHSIGHPRLSLLADEEVRAEIEGSKREIEAQISRPVGSFAYPHGGRGDFDDRCRREAARAGYVSAVAAYYETDVLGDLFALKRHGVNSNWRDFLKVVHGMKHLKLALGLANW